MDERTQSPIRGQASMTMQERMRLLESTAKKLDEGQEVVVRGAAKSPTQKDGDAFLEIRSKDLNPQLLHFKLEQTFNISLVEKDAAGFTVPQAGRREEEDEGLCMPEAHSQAMAASKARNEAGFPNIEVLDLEPGSARTSTMSTKERKGLEAPSLYALSIISPIKEPQGQATQDRQQQERIGLDHSSAAKAHNSNLEVPGASTKHIAENESQASKDQQHEAPTQNMNQSPTSTYRNLIMSPSEQLTDSKVAADNLKGGASGPTKLFDVAGHGQNLRKADGYGGIPFRVPAENRPNEQQKKVRTATSCVTSQLEHIGENHSRVPAQLGLHDHVFTFGSFVSTSSGIPLSPLAPHGRDAASKSSLVPAAREKNLLDQIRQLKKLMWHKESEFSKDKALWIQKYELADQELIETRSRMDKQKNYYLGLITSLKSANSNPNSPVRQSQSQSWPTSPPEDITDRICSSKISQGLPDGIEAAEASQQLGNGLLSQKVGIQELSQSLQDSHLELQAQLRAQVLAQQLKEKETLAELASLQEKLQLYENQIQIQEQNQLEFNHQDAQKNQKIESLEHQKQALQKQLQDKEKFTANLKVEIQKMAEKGCVENQIRNDELLKEKKQMEVMQEEMKNKEQEIEMYFTERSRLKAEIGKLNELVAQLKSELEDLGQQLEENEEYTERLEDGIKKQRSRSPLGASQQLQVTQGDGQNGSLFGMVGQGFHPAGRPGQGAAGSQQQQQNAYLRSATVLNQELGLARQQSMKVQDEKANQEAIKEELSAQFQHRQAEIEEQCAREREEHEKSNSSTQMAMLQKDEQIIQLRTQIRELQAHAERANVEKLDSTDQSYNNAISSKYATSKQPGQQLSQQEHAVTVRGQIWKAPGSPANQAAVGQKLQRQRSRMNRRCDLDDELEELKAHSGRSSLVTSIQVSSEAETKEQKSARWEQSLPAIAITPCGDCSSIYLVTNKDGISPSFSKEAFEQQLELPDANEHRRLVSEAVISPESAGLPVLKRLGGRERRPDNQGRESFCPAKNDLEHTEEVTKQLRSLQEAVLMRNDDNSPYFSQNFSESAIEVGVPVNEQYLNVLRCETPEDSMPRSRCISSRSGETSLHAMPRCRVPAARDLPEIFEDVSSQDDEGQPLRVEIDLKDSMVSEVDVAVPVPHKASGIGRESQGLQPRRDDMKYTESQQMNQSRISEMARWQLQKQIDEKQQLLQLAPEMGEQQRQPCDNWRLVTIASSTQNDLELQYSESEEQRIVRLTELQSPQKANQQRHSLGESSNQSANTGNFSQMLATDLLPQQRGAFGYEQQRRGLGNCDISDVSMSQQTMIMDEPDFLAAKKPGVSYGHSKLHQDSSQKKLNQAGYDTSLAMLIQDLEKGKKGTEQHEISAMSTEENQEQRPQGNHNDFRPEEYVTVDVLMTDKQARQPKAHAVTARGSKALVKSSMLAEPFNRSSNNTVQVKASIETAGSRTDRLGLSAANMPKQSPNKKVFSKILLSSSSASKFPTKQTLTTATPCAAGQPTPTAQPTSSSKRQLLFQSKQRPLESANKQLGLSSWSISQPGRTTRSPVNAKQGTQNPSQQKAFKQSTTSQKKNALRDHSKENPKHLVSPFDLLSHHLVEPSRTSQKGQAASKQATDKTYQTTAGKQSQPRPDLNEICIRKYDLDLVMAPTDLDPPAQAYSKTTSRPVLERKFTFNADNNAVVESIDTVRVGDEKSCR